jgi:hypothetical protein
VRKWLVVVALVVVAAGGTFAALVLYPAHLFRASLDAGIKGLPPGYTASYASADYSLLRRHATLTGFRFAHPEPGAFDVSVDRLEVDHPSTDFATAWSSAAADPTKVAPNLALVLGDEVDAEAVAYQDADESVSLASAHMLRPRVFPWAVLHPGVPSLAEARAALLTEAHAPQPGDLLPVIRAQAPWILGIACDGYTAQSLKATEAMPAAGNMPAGTISYDVRKMESGKSDRGDTASESADGITVTSPSFGSITVARVAVAGLTLQQPLTRLLNGETPVPDMLDGIAIKSLSFGPMSAQPPAGPASSLGTFSLADIAFAGGMLISGTIAFEGFRVNRDQIPTLGAAEMFDQLGLDTMTISLSAAYKWDRDKKVMSIANATAKVNELGALSLSVELAGVGAAADIPAKAKLTHLLLHYDDASFADRAIKFAAEQQGGDPASLREAIIAAAQNLGAAPGTDPATAATARAVGDFVASPHSLTIELNPPEPVPLIALFAAGITPPGRLVPRLGITVSANR